MAGYIGSKSSVTQVDGYNRTEADDRYVNASGDTMTGNLSTTGNIKATNGFLAGANNTYLYEGASNTLNIRIGETGPYAEFVDAGSGVLKIGNASGRLSLTSNGIERVHLDDAGRVTMPYQPSFAGRFVGTMNGTTIVFDSVGHNDGGMYNASIGRFTAPVAGKYLYQAILLKTENVTTRVDVIYNGTSNHNLGQEMSYSSTSGYDHLVINSIYKMSAGDWIDLNIGGGSLNYNSSPSAQFNCLSIALLG